MTRNRITVAALTMTASLAAAYPPPGFYGILDGDGAMDVTDAGLALIEERSLGFVWNPFDGFLWDGIPGPPLGFSDDGTFAVGVDNEQPFWWTRDGGGKVTIPPPGGGASDGVAVGVTADGQVAAGYSFHIAGEPDQAWYWTLFGGTVGIGSLVQGGASRAADITADGRVIVGHAESNHPLGSESFIWTQAGGIEGIGNLDGFTALPRGVSDDGSTIVGMAHSIDNQRQAFRWTRDGGMVGLGDLNDVLPLRSRAEDASVDGSVVVGAARKADEEIVAFIWTAELGMQDLNRVARDEFGFDLGNWTMVRAVAVSADGHVIGGNGHYFDGNAEISGAWVLVLPEDCAADLDGDSDVDVTDFFLYLDFFAAGDAAADIDGDGVIDVNDFFAYLDRFAEGC